MTPDRDVRATKVTSGRLMSFFPFTTEQGEVLQVALDDNWAYLVGPRPSLPGGCYREYLLGISWADRLLLVRRPALSEQIRYRWLGQFDVERWCGQELLSMRHFLLGLLRV